MVMVDNDQEDAAGSHGELIDKDSPVTTAFELYHSEVILFMLVPLIFQTAMALFLHSRKSHHVFFTTTKAIIIGK